MNVYQHLNIKRFKFKCFPLSADNVGPYTGPSPEKTIKKPLEDD